MCFLVCHALVLGFCQSQKFIDCQPAVPNEGAKRPYGKLPVLWNGEVGVGAGLRHDHMAPYLPGNAPPGFRESLYSFLARNVGETGHSI